MDINELAQALIINADSTQRAKNEEFINQVINMNLTIYR
jgi:hypothetical protein